MEGIKLTAKVDGNKLNMDGVERMTDIFKAHTSSLPAFNTEYTNSRERVMNSLTNTPAIEALTSQANQLAQLTKSLGNTSHSSYHHTDYQSCGD